MGNIVDKDILEKLKSIVLFSDFTNDEKRLEKCQNIMKKEKFKTSDYIIKEGDFGDILYILYSGKVRILRNTLSNDEYTVVILDSKDHIFFGEVALIDSDRRSASVVAETDCEALSIDRKNFIKLCEDDPLMGYKIVLQIAKRISGSLRKMNKDVITLFEALVNEVEGGI
jgi:CRP/FNR family transcriptional regulator, cyclic AMP receptor protein